MSRPPLPPFTAETAAQKARMAEDAWNSRDPARGGAGLYYRQRWRNRAEFIQGRAEIEAFLTPQMAAGTRLSPDQGGLGLSRQPDRVRVSPTNGATMQAAGSAPMATKLGIR